MAITTEYRESKNSIIISFSHDNLKDLEKIENFYFQILCKIFIGKQLYILTIEPQRHSLLEKVEVFYEIIVKGIKILINEIENVEYSILQDISASEEFARSLLYIVHSENVLNNEDIESIVRLRMDKQLKPYIKLAFCEDDGASLYLYNTNVDLKDLVHLQEKHLF